MSETIIYSTTGENLLNTRYGLTNGGQLRFDNIRVKEPANPDNSLDNVTAGAKYRMSQINTTPIEARRLPHTHEAPLLIHDNQSESSESLNDSPTRRELRHLERAEYNANHRIRRFGSKILDLALKPFAK